MASVTGMEQAPGSYQAFVVENRKRVNRYLNRALWFFILIGPALALGTAAGIFTDTDYITCLGISLSGIVLAAVHMVLVKQLPESMLTSAFALTALDGVLAYMAFAHVDVHLAWFIVPLLSILFCDKRLYFYALAVNYVVMLVATATTAPYYAGLNMSFETGRSYFLSMLGGYTIEMFVMAVSGYMVVRLLTGYLEEMFRQREVIAGQERSAQEKMDVLDSMAEIYDNVNLISFVENTEMSLRDANQEKHGIDMAEQTHTLMNQRLQHQILPDQLEDFLTFTNITTVRERMKGKKIISADFVDVDAGWLRAQYITVEKGPDDMPNVVIYTTRNVDDEKKREEHLIQLSITDELTRLHNRRSYVDDLTELRDGTLDDDLVVFSVDVDGLKVVNDTLGHAAGDELIVGAANCLARSVRRIGKAYRTGGDEFMAIAHTDDPEHVRQDIQKRAGEWRGAFSSELVLSVGYAALRDNPGSTVDDLEHKADNDMYAEKERHYRESGKDRRSHNLNTAAQ